MRKTGILTKTLQANQAEQAVCTVGRETFVDATAAPSQLRLYALWHAFRRTR